MMHSSLLQTLFFTEASPQLISKSMVIQTIQTCGLISIFKINDSSVLLIVFSLSHKKYLFPFIKFFSLKRTLEFRPENASVIANRIRQSIINSMIKQMSAVLAGGCFWCIEAQFQRVRGVLHVASGYTGGKTQNPTYKQVCSETTGHYQAIKVRFDPSIISYNKILQIFFVTHDPTQTDGQGYDIGTRYLSAIFYSDEYQKKIAQQTIKRLKQEQGIKVATRLLPLQKFWVAEDYHQNYFNQNGDKNPYCNIIPGKIAKIKKYFKQYFVQ